MLITTGASAQNFEKGDWVLRADVSNLRLSHSFADQLSTTSFDAGVATGYFLADKLAVEAQLGLDWSKIKGTDASSDFTFGAGVRYYPVGNLFARVGYAGRKRDGSDLTSSGRDLSSFLMAAVGYDLFLSDKVFFEPAVVYSDNLGKNEPQSLGLLLGLGVRF